jgi:putative ABC transport system permease protein
MLLLLVATALRVAGQPSDGNWGLGTGNWQAAGAFSSQFPVPSSQERTIAIDERLAADVGLRVGDRVVIAAAPGGGGDTVRVAAIVRRGADPSEVARGEPRVRLHLDHLQSLLRYGDRVDRFAVATPSEPAAGRALAAINSAAFGFLAHRSRDIAVETSETFRVVSRFHRAIGVITIVASAIFLLCILLLKVEERRRDVAALRLLGVSRASVMRSVVIEAALVAALGSALGVAIGWATSALVNAHYQALYRTPLRFSIVTPEIVVLAASLSLALGVLAGALAGLRLVRTPPLALLGR